MTTSQHSQADLELALEQALDQAALFRSLVRSAADGSLSDGSERCPWCYVDTDAPASSLREDADEDADEDDEPPRHAPDCPAVAALATPPAVDQLVLATAAVVAQVQAPIGDEGPYQVIVGADMGQGSMRFLGLPREQARTWGARIGERVRVVAYRVSADR